MKRVRPLHLTREDWVEIYYALDYKKTSPAVAGSDREARRWQKHLDAIIDAIGPDGDTAAACGVEAAK